MLEEASLLFVAKEPFEMVGEATVKIEMKAIAEVANLKVSFVRLFKTIDAS